MNALRCTCGKALFQPRDQINVVLERQIGMQAADDVKLGDRLGVAGRGGVPDLFQRHGVGAGRVLLASEGAQAAGRYANVGVVNVAVDIEVSDVAVHPLANMVRQPADRQNVTRAVERQRVVSRQTFVRHHLVVNGPKARVVGLEGVKLLSARGVLGNVGHRFNDNAPGARSCIRI